MTMRIKGLWAVTVVAAGALFAACDGDAHVPTMSGDLQYLDADWVLVNGRHVMTNEDGVRTADLLFDTMYQWRDSTQSALRGVDLRVFTETGAERAWVTSLRGTLDSRSERLTANGNVVLVVPGQERQLETEELHYDPEEDRIWSDSSFVMLEEERTFRGSWFTSDTEFRNFTSGGSGN